MKQVKGYAVNVFKCTLISVYPGRESISTGVPTSAAEKQHSCKSP